jgi:hypothetical protein
MDKHKREKGQGDFPWAIIPTMVVFWLVVYLVCHWIIFS